MEFLGFSLSLVDAGIALGMVIGSVILADVLIILFDKTIMRLAAKTKTTLDDELFTALRGPFKLFFFIFGVYFAVNFLYPGAALLDHSFDFLLFQAIIVAIGHAAAMASGAFIKWYSADLAAKGKSKVKDVFPLAGKLIKIAVYFATLIIILSNFGVEITPLLAGLGVAGLAVALALQPTLANFFAGIYLLSDKPFKVGDRISIDSEGGLTGNVVEIGWRTTKMRAYNNTVYVLPNDKLANSTVVNYDSHRQEGRSVVVTVGVSYDSKPEKVEKALRDAIAEVRKKNDNLVKDFKTIVRFGGFGDSALNFKAIFQVKRYGDRFEAADQANRAIFKHLKKNRIEIPFPIRTVYMHKGK